MPSDIDARASELRARRVPFVHARVVLAEAPTSAKPGDTALVLGDGTMVGFVGGTCAEATVRAQALALLDTGAPLLLRISPVDEPARPGAHVVHNPCLSGGTIEVFLEPVVPSPLVVVVGDAPIAHALRSLGERLGYEMRSSLGSGDDEARPSDASAVVVASHGRGEEQALTEALAADVGYVGLVASRTRGQAVLDSLGLCGSITARVRTPAGLDIGARSPEEVALSILAEIVATRPRPSERRIEGEPADRPNATTSVDPVCGMTVVVADDALHLDHDGVVVYFCGSGCLRAFAADPDRYAAAAAP